MEYGKTQEPLSHSENKYCNKKAPGKILLIFTKALMSKISFQIYVLQKHHLNISYLNTTSLTKPCFFISWSYSDNCCLHLEHTQRGAWRKFKAYLKYSPRYWSETSSPYSRYGEIINGH